MEKVWKELRNITTIDLAFQAKNILEKILWVIIGIIGTVWVFYFIGVQFKFWAQHPYHVTKGDFKLADINYPAITICSKGSTKYGIAERLGNYIDSSKVRVKDFPVKLLLLYAASFTDFQDHYYYDECDAGCKVGLEEYIGDHEFEILCLCHEHIM